MLSNIESHTVATLSNGGWALLPVESSPKTGRSARPTKVSWTGNCMYFRKVLVGLDLEARDLRSADDIPAETRTLFERALEIAVAQRGALKLCAVVDGLDLTRVPASPMQVSAVTGYLAERLETLEEIAHEAGVECETCLLGGVAWVELLRQADEFAADLLIVGAGSRPDRFGATASKVLRFASCPVLVERPQAPASSAPDAADDPEPPHVLLADDLSDVGQQMLMTFVGCGLWRDAKCWLAHVVEPIRWPEAWRYGRKEEDVAQQQTERVEAARQALYQQLGVTDHRTMTYGILPHVLEGSAVETLPRLIAEWHIDLLVCGTASRLDETGFGFGPTVETLLPHVRCSVLAFKPPGVRSPIPDS